jgi:hypothetical protein
MSLYYIINNVYLLFNKYIFELFMIDFILLLIDLMNPSITIFISESDVKLVVITIYSFIYLYIDLFCLLTVQ